MKRGLSPVIATVLLISIVIALALIVFLWAKGFIKEAVEKQGLPAEQACDEVELEASVAGGFLYLTNRGNIPIFEIEKIEKTSGRTDKENIEVKLNVGQTKSAITVTPGAEVEIIPIILGESESGVKKYVCRNRKIIAE